MPEALNAVIYARYSSDRQTEQSIEGQLRECYAFAKANDIAVIDTYIDRAISGKTDNRPAFQKMIEDSAKRQFQAVIVCTASTASPATATTAQFIKPA